MQQNLAILSSLASLLFVTSITPGPNNILLMSSGMHFGVRRSLPLLSGMVLGFAVLLTACFVGVGAVFAYYPWLEPALAIACAFYLAHLALLQFWRPMTSGGTSAATRTPLGFVEAALFQWVNPKVWAIALSATAVMSQTQLPKSTASLVLFMFSGAIGLPCFAVWAVFGSRLSGLIQKPRANLILRCCMAALLLATAIWMLEPLGLQWPNLQLFNQHPAVSIGR